MASNFEGVKQALFDAEGGYADVTGDHGGVTKWGVSKASYPNLDIENLTFDQACSEVFEPDYWNKYRLSEIRNQKIANKIFLALINLNPINAVKCVQKAIVDCGGIIKIDGVMGSATIAAINCAPQGWLLDALRIELSILYLSIVKADESQLKFLEGWIGRALT